MNQRATLCFGILGASLAMGLLGNALLRAVPWGLNAALWIAALAGAMLLLGRRRALPAPADAFWLLPSVLLFGAAFAWRDSPTLKTLNGLAVFALLSVAALRTRTGKLRLAAVTEYPLAALLTFCDAVAGAIPLLAIDMPWADLPRGPWSRRLGAVVRGLFLAAPLLLVFGGLFVAADAGFERMVTRLFSWNGEEMIVSGVVTGFTGWLVCGYLRRVLVAGLEDAAAPVPPIAVPPAPDAVPRDVLPQVDATAQPPPSEPLPLPSQPEGGAGPQPAGGPRSPYQPPPPPAPPRLGLVELGVVLGLLNLLFGAFVATQVHWFFGGDALVRSAIPLTYAEYARRGFFELTTVAALALPLLLLFHWLQDEAAARTRLFPILAGALVALLFVIMASAVMRMRIYQLAYGMTELRVYTMAFMLFLATVFGWFAWTVLRGNRDRFAFGSLILALLTAAGLNLLNPDAVIVRANVPRVSAGRFDPGYCTVLSLDAVPALIEAAGKLPSKDRKALIALLEQDGALPWWRYRATLAPGARDWRAWSWSRQQARRSLETLPGRTFQMPGAL